MKKERHELKVKSLDQYFNAKELSLTTIFTFISGTILDFIKDIHYYSTFILFFNEKGALSDIGSCS